MFWFWPSCDLGFGSWYTLSCGPGSGLGGTANFKTPLGFEPGLGPGYGSGFGSAGSSWFFLGSCPSFGLCGGFGCGATEFVCTLTLNFE